MNDQLDNGTRAHRARGRGRKAFWILFWALVVAGVISAAWTPPQARDGRSRADAALLEWDVDRIATAIDATEAQRQALEPVLERARTAAVAADRERRVLRAELLAQFQAEEPDPAAIAALRERAVALSESALDSAFELTLELWAELTPEQRAEALRHWDRRG